MWKPGKLASWIAVAGLAWCAGYVYNARYGGELSWLRMMYEQKMQLANQVKGQPRLLVIGGSGAHYTVDAKRMQEKLGIPVLNLAVDGPVGLDVILPSVSEAIRPGDIVLLIPEYLILLDDDGFGDRSVPFAMAIGHPELVQKVPAEQLAQDVVLLGAPTLKAISKSTVDLIEKGKLTGYYSDPLDENGGPTVLKTRDSAEWWQLRIKKPISNHAYQRIAKFREEVEAKGATLVLGLSWIYASTDPETVRNVQKTAEQLAKIAPVLYDKDSLNLKTDSSLFADTHYHLNYEATQTRSSELVQQLKPVINSKLKTPDSTSTSRLVQ